MSLAAYPLVRDWLASDAGTLTVRTGKVDIGQRISTALIQIAHEETTLPYHRIRVAPVVTGISPDEGITSGSNSLEQSGRALRAAAATLRTALLQSAAERLGADPVLQDGTVTGPGSNAPVDLLDLWDELPPDLPVDAQAPQRANTTGKAPPMMGISDMVRGAHCFVHDLDVPGMEHARLVRPPHINARLVALNEGAVEKLKAEGLHVFRDGSLLAVSGHREWKVVRAAERLALAAQWDEGSGLSEADPFERLTPDAALRRLPVVDGTPQDAPPPAPLPAPDYAARYERPYTMHASLAPSAALAMWDGQSLKITCHSQGIYPLRGSIAESLGLDEARVEITHAPGSGCYGHNGADDAAFEAALIALSRPGVPILLKWTREQEHAWEPYGPAAAVNVAAKMEDDRIVAYAAEAISETHRGRPRFGPEDAGPRRLLSNRFRAEPRPAYVGTPTMGREAGIHRNLTPAYAFPEMRLTKSLAPQGPHRTSALRCLGAPANVLAHESLLDEMCLERGLDPFAFRRQHLTDARALAVLHRLERVLASSAGLSESGARGIAYAQYKNQMTRVAAAVDLSVDETAEVRLHSVSLVADAGRIVDRNGLVAQLEGGAIQGASWALYEAVVWDRDGPVSRDWESYRVLRFTEAPRIDVHLINRPDCASLGAGEASPAPVMAAIANALARATGLRMRRLPLTPEAIMAAALET